ncbi:hypothetical protein K488DRAFT_77892 [Vararia minispora EC-137]|uniref:Uncharacterized protein n=1 Tax=Vararia minispora EC-137 TaxID=1314806 RepID=A0ACB8QPU8_9AGAM|nr:hypothetical protein K488DRAFT_77892 [Vararia minispora EC-137]
MFSSAVQEKMHIRGQSQSWTVPLSIPIPGAPRRRPIRIPLPNIARAHALATARFGRRRGMLVLVCVAIGITFCVYSATKRISQVEKWGTPMDIGLRDASTLVYEREDLQKIWEWEIASGHYPSNRELPRLINFTSRPFNPALPPPRNAPIVLQPKPPSETVLRPYGHGPKRVYLDIQAKPPDVAYPPRPVPGSVADMDVVMDHCDFSAQKYVRDCLEVLRLGGGLDNENRVRRGKMDEWKYIYMEVGDVQEKPTSAVAAWQQDRPSRGSWNFNYGLPRKSHVENEPHLTLPPPRTYKPYHSLRGTCDPENPRVYHMFWTGPFTDKPYIALMSFLFTQNVRLHLHEDAPDALVCRPQFWMWINPGPAAAVPNPNALHDMFEQLKSNPWASPFLHPRFKDIIKFRMWNTTEQLDGVPEIKDDWRVLEENMFNSGGHIISIPKKVEKSASEKDESEKKDEDNMLNRLGSKSASSYDRLSVILSDMARFVLCHRFGGIYLDADTIFLRDWEELWGWHGAFAYRWSRLENYNTAVLRMHRNSALGTFIFRTALKNGLDFHPMSITKYLKHAQLEGLLLRLPDALFDSAWLNTEDYQRNRPPQPYFTEFEDFFDTPTQNSAAPQALGFEGFFRGAYSYHFHNFWWEPFDRSRNWPDLGPKFIDGERRARLGVNVTGEFPPDMVKDDKRDLDWATVLKRTFESYVRGERPNMYGEWLQW